MLREQIFSISSETQFKTLALEVFNYQYEHVTIYHRFCNLLKVAPKTIERIEDIPFLPIQFFKQTAIISDEKISEVTFTSSGTTGSITSKHYVASLSLYEDSFINGFKRFYGDPTKWTILALLPSYLERSGSSLIYMFDRLITASGKEHSGFYLNNLDELIKKIEFLENHDEPTLLLGVSYALLDLIEKRTFELKNTTIMETGGMKGRRKELIKEELHMLLKKGFGVPKIHSEYGMTELLSQGYSNGDGLFTCPPWMKVLTREPEDPLHLIQGKTGGVNVIDLANLNSCAFIATQDLGKTYSNGTFEILGRFDESDIRGCNLMVL